MNELVKPRDPAAVLPALRSGERPLTEEISLLLDRLDRYEEQIESLLPDEKPDERRERLFEEAAALEKRWPDPARRPCLFGAVIGVKDLFHARGFPTRAGSALPAEVFYDSREPAGGGEESSQESPVYVENRSTGTTRARTSSESVERLQNEGALILGKTVTTEFAYFGPGPTRNPWNTNHTPGGSSSGSAAAVAGGFCHFALGTQTIGSISRPASFCGVAGYKPSFGRISAEGVIPFSPNADHVGVIAPSARALETAASALAREWHAPTAALTSPRRGSIRHHLGTVLMPDDAYLAQADEDARMSLHAVRDRLQGLGVSVQEIDAFPDIADINQAHQDMIAYDFAQVHEKWYASYGDRYQEKSRELVERGRSVSAERHTQTRSGRITLRERLENELQQHGASLWIAPATVSDAPSGIDATGNPVMNLPWTYAGLPTVSLPLISLPHGTGQHGLPLGVQAVAPFGADEELLAMAIMLEDAFR